ncbi:DUF2938 domain-containing protein [Chitinimonas sp. BJYL2]|uniref:DUF2938 domain-containing protein n=1 Tax=Chitinimonas sp. BJYL2 TaxID=2976696 RepID=UPI0022B5AE55|nr:DUF2938 domain-containing protein [Chitinimonas sp. BJYL2]
MHDLIRIVMIGAGATLLIDIWAIARQRWLGVPPPNYGLVGRWLAHMPKGRFRHEAIAKAAPVAGEKYLGWLAHYLIGMAFAAIVPLLWGRAWLDTPTLFPALLVGVATVAAPFLLMQPGMGAGIAARRTSKPAAARWQSLITHTVFGAGLYAVASLIQLVPAQ